ncbi:MAG: ABC transporter permease [Mesorhizobium amorphae]|nr:MAG: ABC transporter permease [Mesorhizobium amorphae]
MKPRTFLFFVAPSLLLMVLFIALPLLSVFVQSFQLTQRVFEQVTVETCTPGFVTDTCTEETRTRPKVDEAGRPVTETRWVGLETYRTLLQPDAVRQAFASGNLGALLNIDFYKALRFTLTFTLLTLPLVLVLGLALALAVNSLTQSIRGPVIFVSLLPFIITPVIGALSIRWLFVGDGIMTALLSKVLGYPVSVFSNGWAIEALMMFYRVWHVTPFAFVIFYAGLQTVNQDVLESAMIDGASRLERLRFVVIPHLMPLILFVALIHLMDTYRAFDEVVGFSTQAYRISLQWLTYGYLIPDGGGNRAIGRASASSMLTMIGIVILLLPLIRQAWRDHKARQR